ncbi:MAG: cytochrome c3 family protein [Candidatus Wallbacteria bacterium]|nr:cytochrome c3 family protein [Candidatus Wallbacteria bacterium]
MTLDAKRYLVGFLALLFLAGLLIVAWVEGGKQRLGHRITPAVPPDSRDCVTCHKVTSPVVVGQWEDSRHAQKGVGCFTCHEALKDDVDGFEHHGRRIATIVSPKDCSRCHNKEFHEQQGSRHADAASFIGSLDNFLGEIVEGGPAAALGCKQCHGSEIKVMPTGKLDPATWPNGGMGRINPDKSKGSCAACHYRHDFSLAIARSPETCGKCHMGPDHPQIEIYNESKHGVRFATFRNQMNLNAQPWVAGKDYWAAPTCATCHMSATKNQGVTHDVGTRLSWTLRPVISTRLDKWEDKRKNMLDVCNHCHSEQWAKNYFTQFDSFVDLYNDKFAKPAKEIMDGLKAANKLTKTPFDETIEWTFYELWHHEGRRGRHGAAMMGPDFVQWHGAYEVAKHFYNKFLPEAKELDAALVEKVIGSSQHHTWLKGLTKEQVESQIQFYKQRYGQ